VCGAPSGLVVVQRRGVPVHQNMVFKKQADAVAIARGDLDFRACERCGFVFNAAFDPDLLNYSADYDNTQLMSPSFLEYVRGLVRHLVEERGVRDADIVEVGCGKGGFIRALVEYPGANNSGIGFDPSYVGPDSDLGGRLRFERRFYDGSCTDVPADVVASRHVIEHVAQPLDLLRAIKAALVTRPGARIFLETPCVEWILKNEVVWDFFYEHCSLFTAESLATACQIVGFSVNSVTHLFGGQYLWLEATNVTCHAGAVPQLSSAFKDAECEHRERWQALVEETSRQGCVAVWGAGAKGVTFVNLVDPRRTHIACVVDVNPSKQGAFVASSGHPIVAPRDLATYGVTHALLLNPNYRGEVQSELRAEGLDVKLMDIGAPEFMRA
jgi:SAM-dependent methyltransferase